MSINISELIWTVICFFVLLVVLKKLLFDPLVSFMAARDARIQDGLNAGRTAQQQLDAAARARSEAQRKQAAAQATRAMRARVRDEETAAAAAVDAKLPELVTALTGGLLGSDAAERNAAQIRQWVAPAHEG